MPRFRILWNLTSLVALLLMSGCSSVLPASGLPTLLPTEYIPTAVALTAQAMIARSPSATSPATPSQTPTPETEPSLPASTNTPKPSNTPRASATSTATPSPTLSPTPRNSPTSPPPFELPFGDIQIISPGPLSKVVSPIELRAFLTPGANGRVSVELLGEDGRLLYRKIFVFDAPPDARANLYANLSFEIAGVAETARLVISTDDEYGRLKALTSEDLILLSIGDADINPSGDLLKPIVIQQPTLKVLVQGGDLVVSGLVRTASDQPLLVELIAADGRVVGSRLAGIADGPKDAHRLFAVEIPYTVSSPTWVRVTISERGERMPGTVQLSSVEVLLGP